MKWKSPGIPRIATNLRLAVLALIAIVSATPPAMAQGRTEITIGDTSVAPEEALMASEASWRM